MLRELYYRLSPRWRFIVRKWWYWPQDWLRNNSELVPPKGLIYTGRGDFLAQGKAWQAFFTKHGLTENAAFLDIGSGIGRIALGLTPFLKGRYLGFEAMELGANWCQEHITPRFPNFEFQHIPLHNDLYNSEGIDAATFQFPFDANFYDFACAISVFSHMIDTEVENYLHQTHRVLKQGGRLIGTFFISDHVTANSQPANASFRFKYSKGHYSLMDEKIQSANVCFDANYLFALIEKAGFRLIQHFPGSWSGRPDATEPLAFQDILILEK